MLLSGLRTGTPTPLDSSLLSVFLQSELSSLASALFHSAVHLKSGGDILKRVLQHMTLRKVTREQRQERERCWNAVMLALKMNVALGTNCHVQGGGRGRQCHVWALSGQLSGLTFGGNQGFKRLCSPSAHFSAARCTRSGVAFAFSGPRLVLLDLWWLHSSAEVGQSLWACLRCASSAHHYCSALKGSWVCVTGACSARY